MHETVGGVLESTRGSARVACLGSVIRVVLSFRETRRSSEPKSPNVGKLR